MQLEHMTVAELLRHAEPSTDLERILLRIVEGQQSEIRVADDLEDEIEFAHERATIAEETKEELILELERSKNSGSLLDDFDKIIDRFS